MEGTVPLSPPFVVGASKIVSSSNDSEARAVTYYRKVTALAAAASLLRTDRLLWKNILQISFKTASKQVFARPTKGIIHSVAHSALVGTPILPGEVRNIGAALL